MSRVTLLDNHSRSVEPLFNHVYGYDYMCRFYLVSG